MTDVSSPLERYSDDSKLTEKVTVPPHLLRYNLKHVIQDRLARNIRNRCTEKDGFVLKLKHVAEIRGGLLDKRSGSAKYQVDYIASTLRPHEGDVVEAIVTRVFKIGVFADLGPLNIFIPLSRVPAEFNFQSLPSPQFTVAGDTSRDIRPGSDVHIRIEKIEMLDDDFRPTNSTRCVLKAMGELVGVRASYAGMTRIAQSRQSDNFLSVASS
jgi:DNA-directed RNA polymerase II subunit RPB7